MMHATPANSSVAYGFRYHDKFINKSNVGRAISYDIICPDKAGGNVEDFLYLMVTGL